MVEGVLSAKVVASFLSTLDIPMEDGRCHSPVSFHIARFVDFTVDSITETYLSPCPATARSLAAQAAQRSFGTRCHCNSVSDQFGVAGLRLLCGWH